MSAESSASDQKSELVSRLILIKDSIESSLRQNSDLLDEFPVDRCVEAAQFIDRYSFSATIPDAQKSILRKLRRKYDAVEVYDWNRLTLLLLLQRRISDEQFQALPPGIQKWSFTWFEQMLDRASHGEDHFDFENPDGSAHLNLCFDFAVAAGRLLPVGGAWVVDRSRMLRSSLFGSRERDAEHWRQAFRGLGKVMRRKLGRLASVRRAYSVFQRFLIPLREAQGRYGSYLVIHTADHYRRWFSERYQQLAFRNIAALLELDPTLEGLYRSSWLLDPQVIELEPRLRFLTAVPTENGARYGWRSEFNIERRSEILEFSAARQKKFSEGSYRPQEWAYLWPRDALTKWAESK